MWGSQRPKVAVPWGVSCPDGGTARRSAEYAGDPARDASRLLWETFAPKGVRVGNSGQGACAGADMLPGETAGEGEGIRTCTACCGTGMLVHAWATCLPSLFAMGDPRGAAGFASGTGCGVFSLSGRGLDCRPPPRARDRMGERGPRSTFDSQLTIGDVASRLIR